eukprot:gnl/TRDRNA2_/TRDRNA2_84402_c0_seq1.p1 gnl/TRDRNA2_/TRDRNA2_84402_c0~~gnl/TRDRNA2_/TRDRNA2_84402_c0_seq1.p1  ORF type:complete len:301 (-),score=39.08 gnl/TRDRNA2_/TRDRNA2_84402_c0_seq1:213-1115(-)
MSSTSLPLVEPLVKNGPRRCWDVKDRALLVLIFGIGLVALLRHYPQANVQRLAAQEPADVMFWQDLQPVWTNHSEERQLFHTFARRDPFKEPSREADLPGPNTGQYIARSFASKVHSGPDGKVVSERYASSSAGNGRNRIHEARHLYSDSSGLEKSSHEQHVGGRSRLLVTETQRGNQSKSSQILRGMEEPDANAFDQDFNTNATHLPRRAELSQDAWQAPLKKSDFHKWPRRRPMLGVGRNEMADLFDHDLWETPHRNLALPFAHDEEFDDSSWHAPLNAHGFFLSPFSSGIHHRIRIV